MEEEAYANIRNQAKEAHVQRIVKSLSIGVAVIVLDSICWGLQ